MINKVSRCKMQQKLIRSNKYATFYTIIIYYQPYGFRYGNICGYIVTTLLACDYLSTTFNKGLQRLSKKGVTSWKSTLSSPYFLKKTTDATRHILDVFSNQLVYHMAISCLSFFRSKKNIYLLYVLFLLIFILIFPSCS